MTADPVPAAPADLSIYVCNRWTRYGHDRLYVTSPPAQEGGAPVRLGYRDLKTEVDHPDDPRDAATLATVIATWRGRQPATSSKPAVNAPRPSERTQAGVQTTPPAPPAPSSPPERPWVDLSRNTAGAAVRQQASVVRAQAPVRTAVGRLFGKRTEETSWRVGAKGETLVGRELAELTRRHPLWTSIHAIPVGQRGTDIDHLVMGPGGVFTVNTKHHAGADIWVGGETFLVNGRRVPYVRNARFEAERAARLLSAASSVALHVTALVVVVGSKAPITIKSQPRDVFVVTRRDLQAWLLGTGQILPPEVLARTWEAARRSTTWTG